MKKIKLISSLSILGTIGAITPIVATNCSSYKGFIKSVDGSNQWISQPGDIKVFMPMGKDMKPVQNAKWSIKDAKSLEGKITISNSHPITEEPVVFARLQIDYDAIIEKEETITIHAENENKSYCADSYITIKPMSDTATYWTYVDNATTPPLAPYWSIGNIDTLSTTGYEFQLLKTDGTELDNEWKWQVDMFMDPSGNVKNLTFGTTSSGKATLKVAYDVQPQNIVAFCSIIHSQTKAEFTHILVVPAKI